MGSTAEDSHKTQVLEKDEDATGEIKAKDPLEIKVGISDNESEVEGEKMTVQEHTTFKDGTESKDDGGVSTPRLENERQFFSESSSPNKPSGASPRTRRKSKTQPAWKTFLKNA